MKTDLEIIPIVLNGQVGAPPPIRHDKSADESKRGTEATGQQCRENGGPNSTEEWWNPFQQ